jgi:SRSO17 transposase
VLSIGAARAHRERMSTIEYAMDAAAAARVGEFFHDRVGRHLRLPQQRASFATYAFGILGEGDRKSVEPIAGRACAKPEQVAAMHDRLLHFVRESPWSDREVRREAARYVTEVMSAREPVTTWILDDTGFLKQGNDSPGVQRQYTGSSGKVCNCQVGVSLSIATATEKVPIDFALYLPESWTDDPVRRKRARIPKEIGFRTKTDLAIDMIGRAVDDGVPGELVLVDAAYGRSYDLRETVRIFGLDYAVAVDAQTSVWVLDARDRRRGDPVGARRLGVELGERAFRRITWRPGTKPGKLASRFCFRRVKVAHDDGTDPATHEPTWLVIEWPEGEAAPAKFFLSSLPRRMSKKQIVRTIKERWKTERAYQELKGELGLDHYEGRSFIGWHHHVSVVLCCYAFVVAERIRAFPPSRRRTRRHHAVAVAA